MALFFISYDLRKKKDYPKLYEELENKKAVRVLESLWAFNSTSTASDLRDHFADFVDSDDGLTIIESSNWSTRNAKKTPKDLK